MARRSRPVLEHSIDACVTVGPTAAAAVQNISAVAPVFVRLQLRVFYGLSKAERRLYAITRALSLAPSRTYDVLTGSSCQSKQRMCLAERGTKL